MCVCLPVCVYDMGDGVNAGGLQWVDESVAGGVREVMHKINSYAHIYNYTCSTFIQLYLQTRAHVHVLL